jgi:acylphosphatase
MVKTRAHIYVTGLVQGVFFRVNAADKALALGLSGWVMNLPDGRVELTVEGEKQQVHSMIQWCRVGPPAAEVQNVEIENQPYIGEFNRFAVIR